MSYCKNCGRELEGNEKFCPSCGTQAQTNSEEPKKEQNPESKKKTGIVVAAIVIAVAIIVAVVFAWGSVKKEKEYNNTIESAEKFLEEKDYEQAVVAYLDAIKIDEKKLKPYVEVAEIYVDQKEYISAKEILELSELNDAQGSEAEEQEQEELLALVTEITDNMVLDEETVLEIIDPVPMWMLEQFEGFDELTPGKKVELSSIIAHENGVESIENDSYNIYYSKEVLAEVVREYFGEIPDYDQVEDTELITVLEDRIELYWPARGYDYWYYDEVDEIEQQDDGSYVVKVIYKLSDSMWWIGNYDFYQITYTFRYDHTLENGFYIDGMKMENIYKGNEYAEEQEFVYKETLRKEVVEYYTKKWQPQGDYVSFDRDDYLDMGVWNIVIRYQMSDEEAEERIANGGTPSPNIYVTTVSINLETGEVTEEWGDSWEIDLPWE